MKTFCENEKGTEHLVLMSQAEARLLHEIVAKAVERNKRKKSYKTMLNKLDKLPCF